MQEPNEKFPSRVRFFLICDLAILAVNYLLTLLNITALHAVEVGVVTGPIYHVFGIVGIILWVPIISVLLYLALPYLYEHYGMFGRTVSMGAIIVFSFFVSFSLLNETLVRFFGLRVLP